MRRRLFAGRRQALLWIAEQDYVTNLLWMELNDRLLAGRDMEPCITNPGLSERELRMVFANRLRHPKFDAAGQVVVDLTRLN